MGSNVLRQLREAQVSVSVNSGAQVARIPFKMATGSGKTVVMAAIIGYHFANRQEYKSDRRFADYFMIVSPGVTIRDSLRVLFVDPESNLAHQATDYYQQRGLVPPSLGDAI